MPLPCHGSCHGEFPPVASTAYKKPLRVKKPQVRTGGLGLSRGSRLGESNPRPTHYEKPGTLL
jgi:hypothetical protein